VRARARSQTAIAEEKGRCQRSVGELTVESYMQGSVFAFELGTALATAKG
jgi:hypothetical protein